MHKLLITVFFAGTNYVLSQNNTLESEVETLGTNTEAKSADGNESSLYSNESTNEDYESISGEKADNQKVTSASEPDPPYDTAEDSEESGGSRYDKGDKGNETEENERSDESDSTDQISSIVEKFVDKADSVLVFLAWIFQKIDDGVNALNERIYDMRTRMPSVAYGGSLMTIYYTMIPLFYNAKDVFNKMLSCGSNIRKGLGGENKQITEKKTAYRPYYKYSRNKRRRRRPFNSMVSRKPRGGRKNRNKRRRDKKAKTVMAGKRLQIHD